jgi:hypothetical protein
MAAGGWWTTAAAATSMPKLVLSSVGSLVPGLFYIHVRHDDYAADSLAVCGRPRPALRCPSTAKDGATRT